MSTVSPSSLPDDNEDNTVTISLIISEDENGKKRTQVIIPTTDNNKCDICNKSFKTACHLLRHNRLKHAREEDITTRNFPCDLCPKRQVKYFLIIYYMFAYSLRIYYNVIII